MAKNLRAKIPPADTLIICDVNKDVLHKFVEDAASFPAADCMDTLKRKLNIEITTKVREAAERSVSSTLSVYLGFVRRTGPPLTEKYFFETVFYAVSNL